MSDHQDDTPKGGFPVRPSALEGAWRSALRQIDAEEFTDADHARLLLSSMAARLAEQAIHLCQTWTDRERRPAALVADAIELTLVADKVTDYAAVTARERGASWGDIGAFISTTRQSAHTRWGPAETDWRERRAAGLRVHPGVRAAGLDAWTERVSDPSTDPRIPHERRVSAALDVTVGQSGHRIQQAARLPEGRAWNLIDRHHDVASRRDRRVAGFLALVYASLLHDDPGLAPDDEALQEGLGHRSIDTVDAACTRLDRAARDLLTQDPLAWRAVLERFVTHEENLPGPRSPHVAYWHEAVEETAGPDGFPRRKGFPVDAARRLLDTINGPFGPDDESADPHPAERADGLG